MKKLFLYVFLSLILFSHQSFAKDVDKTWQFKCGTRLQDMTPAEVSLIVSMVYDDNSGLEKRKSGKAIIIKDSKRYDFNELGSNTYVDQYGKLSFSSAFGRTNTHFWGWWFGAFETRGILKEFEIGDYKTDPSVVLIEEYECQSLN